MTIFIKRNLPEMGAFKVMSLKSINVNNTQVTEVDEIPIDESNNLAKSGGIANQIKVQSAKIVNDTTGLQIIDITYYNKGVRTTGVESVNIQNPVLLNKQGAKSILAQCNEGDVFTVIHRTYSGTTNLRGFMWLGAPDASGNCAILATQTLYGSQIEDINKSYITPAGAAYVVFNGTELVVTRGTDVYLNSNYLNTIDNRQTYERYIDNIQKSIGEETSILVTDTTGSVKLAKEGDIIRIEVTGLGTSIASFYPKISYSNSNSSSYHKVEKNIIDIPVRHNDLTQVGVRFYKADVLSAGSVTVKVYLISRGYTAAKKELKILVIGSSTEQSYIPYLPPILNEALPGYEITYGNMYGSGTDAADYVNQYKNSTPCEKFNYWGSKDDKWTRYTNSYTLEDVLNKEKWNLIILKGTVEASRQLMRIIQSLVDYPVNFMTDARHSRKYDNKQNTTEETCLNIVNAVKDKVKQTGFMDYIPVGTAIQNARTNSIIRKAGVTWGEARQFSIPANSYLKLEQRIRGLSTSQTLKARRVSGSGEITIDCDSYRVFALADNQEHTVVFSSADTDYIKFTNTGSDSCVVEFINEDSIGDYLLEDDQHLQAGIAVLIAAYTYALKIMDYTSNFHRGINGLCNKFDFIPTFDELSDIGVADGNMDHGKPCGIRDFLGTDGNHYDNPQIVKINGTMYVAETVFNDTPDANSVIVTAGDIIYKNIYAAQEIAEIAVGNPTEITDCSDIVIDIPQKNQL